jgi:hypothetical protein
MGVRAAATRTPNRQKFFGSFFQKRTLPYLTLRRLSHEGAAQPSKQSKRESPSAPRVVAFKPAAVFLFCSYSKPN